MTDSGSQSPRRSLLPAAATALPCASLTPTAAQQTATLSGSVTRGGNADPLAGVIAIATDLFVEQGFQTYGGSVIGRRVLVGVTATF